ncbi:MAG: lysylphosphatidylglycerol synthase transmembrane domain-containing protein [Patescibacteria group bacterium]
MKNSFKFSIKNIILLILLFLGIFLLLPKLVGVEKALLLLVKINKYYLLAALIVEILSYASAAWLLGIIFFRLGYKISFLNRYKLGSIAAFTIHFLPLGVAGEAAFEYSYLKKQKINSGTVILMWILRWIFNYSGFIILFLIGLILVPTYPNLSFSPKIISFTILILIVFTVFYLVYLYKHKNKFWKAWNGIINFINKIFAKFKKNLISDEKIRLVFEDIYKGLSLFGEKKRSSLKAVLAGILYWFGDMLCLYFVFHAFGFSVDFGVLIFGYCIATFLGIISAIPGGVGVTEGSMALIFTSLGVPSAIAITAVLVFRLFSFWIWMPIGFFSYLSLSKIKTFKNRFGNSN